MTDTKWEADDRWSLAGRTAIVCAIVLLFVIGAAAVVGAADVILMLFAAALFAVFLGGLAHELSRRTGLGPRWSLAAVVLSLVVLTLSAGWALVPTVHEQVAQLQERLPVSWDQFRERLSATPWGEHLVESLPEAKEGVPQLGAVLTRTAGVVSSALGAVGVLVVIFFVGLLFAAQPEVYVNGALRLAPRPQRSRARQVLMEIFESLKWWLVAKSASMIVVGALTWLGLAALGVEFAATLAILAALLTFIPSIGPIISAVPAVLMGWMQSPTIGVGVLVLLIVIQILESYVITPLIQFNVLSLPPALTIAALLMAGAWAGLMGVMTAEPLLVLLTVVVRRLYVEDVLDEDADAETS